MTTRWKWVAVFALALFTLVGAASADAEPPTVCTGEIASSEQYQPLTLMGNLTVPAGATCNLSNVVVVGNVLVGTGAVFNSSAQAPGAGGLDGIEGNLTAERAAIVSLGYAEVTGNVVVTDTDEVGFWKVSFDEAGLFVGNGDLSMTFVGFGGNLVCLNNSTVFVFDIRAANIVGQCATSDGA